MAVVLRREQVVPVVMLVARRLRVEDLVELVMLVAQAQLVQQELLVQVQQMA